MRYFKVVVEEITETIEHLWPWHHKGDDGQRDGDKERKLNSNPVLLVPGIGGSILNAVDQNGRKERVWVRLFEADYEFRSKLFSFYDPVTGTTFFWFDVLGSSGGQLRCCGRDVV